MGKKWNRAAKWASNNRALIVGVIFLSYVLISLSQGTPDPRVWLNLISAKAISTSNIITETIGRIVSPGGSSGPGPGTDPDSELVWGVYSDNDCTTTLPTVNWGTLYPGDTKTQIAYVKNAGNLAFSLDLSAVKWTPAEAEQYITLSWDYVEGSEMKSNDVVKVILRLDVSPDIQGVNDFSFDIVVTAIEAPTAAAAAP